MRFARRDVLVFQGAVALHDVTGIVQCSQKVAERLAFGEEDKEIELAVLFHCPDPGPVALQLEIFQCFCLDNLLLFRSNHIFIEVDLLIIQGNLLTRHGDLFL